MDTASMSREELENRVQQLTAAQQDVERMREAMQCREEQYNAAIENTGTAMLVLEDDMTISEGNHKTELITGYSREEIKRRKPFTHYVAPQDQERMTAFFRRRRLDPAGAPTEYEFKLLQRGGVVRNILISVGMIPGTKRSLISLIDITDRVRAEADLRASEQRFRDTAQLLPGIICEWNNAMMLTYTNLKGLETFSLAQDDFKRGISLFDMISPEDRQRAEKDIRNIYHGDFGTPGVYSITRKDGVTLHLLVNSSPIVEAGETKGMRMCIIDITGRMVAEQKLRERERLFKTIVSWSPIGIALCDDAGALLEVNKSFAGLFGIPDESPVAGMSFSVFETLQLPLEKTDLLSKGQSVEHESRMSASGLTDNAIGDRHLAWNITPLEKSDNTRTLYLVQVRDITQQKRENEARIQRATTETEQARREIANLKKEIVGKATFHTMVSRSPRMREIFDILPEVAHTPATVLVTGESGTGKELIARAVHEMSGRKNKPFVAINCSALPDNLLESELFGYKAGAFTDAKKDKPGTFMRANGGRIFLDEIGDISTAMQVKLLRVLQEKTFEPLGATEQAKVDVRIVAATNKDLGDAVKRGEFREDLYYRINVLAVNLPPLRDRRCDIPLLCDHFIERFNTRYNKDIKTVSQEALNVLMVHNFPGNIRELENTIEHAFIFCKDSAIGLAHLPPILRNVAAAAGIQAISHVNDFDELEKLYLQKVLSEAGNNRLIAARKLGIHKATLFRKMHRLGIK